MKRSAKRLFTACLATMVAGAGFEVFAAAEGAAATQDLVNVRAAGQVTASWTRQPDFYALQVVMEPSKPSPPRAIVKVAEALLKQVPQNLPATPTPYVAGDASLDRSSFFVGNTIANLRGLDPAFGCRTLTLVDGRRVVAGQAPAPAPAPSPAPLVQSYPPRIKHPRIEVWLLKADGTQILPAAYTCVQPSASQSKSEEFTYRYTVADSAQAVAAAIRIDNDFYIEKLQPLELKPSGQ